jgi:alkanesulfonate monooxygenase SsuD/methylene tetrahydromethanopterin reductase-like flavin-dependent oxidoreductase (luciferase family)
VPPNSALPEIGVVLPMMSAPGDLPGDVVQAARHAEDLGFESVWAVDQLVGGTGVPLLESTVVLAAAAGATTRVGLGFGVLVVPLRQVTWMAKQVATLQRISGDRVLLGVGVGGDRHEASWPAAGVRRRDRGPRLDAALQALPGLIAGEATTLDGEPGAPTVRLAPGATVPPLLIGGMSPAALARVAEHGDGWFLLPGPPAAVAEARARLTAALAERGRPASAATITAALVVALDGDPEVPDLDGLVRLLSDPDGIFGMPADLVPDVVTTGGPAELTDLLHAYGEAGAHRVIVSVAAGDWRRQTELVARATTPPPTAGPTLGVVRAASGSGG